MRLSNLLSATLVGAAILAAGSAASAATQPAERPLGVEASIPFADSIGIRNFQADGDRALFIEGARGQWYRAEMFGPCWGLDYAQRIGVITRGTSSLDKFGQILVDGSKCQISSLVTSAGPPAKVKTS